MLSPATVPDPRVTFVTGDLADPAVMERAVTPDTESVFHFAATVSGQAEAEFDAVMRVNVDMTRALLERRRMLPRPPKVVFTSSIAVFGGPLLDPVPDDAPATPRSSYSAQKAIGELLVYDMTRKGYIRRAITAIANRCRASGQAEQGRLVVRKQCHPRAAIWHRRALARRAGHPRTGVVATRGGR